MSAGNIPQLLQGQKIVGPDGAPEPWFVDAWNDLLNRTGGMAQDYVGNIINGTQTLADVTISGRGKIVSVIDVINTNVSSVTIVASAAVGGLAATISPASVAGSSAVPATVTTSSTTVTPAGGTAPYIYAWAKVSGDTFAVTAPTAASTTFSVALAEAEFAEAIYRCTVTDNVAATYSVDVTVYALILGF